MSLRTQLPVASPIRGRALLDAVPAALRGESPREITSVLSAVFAAPIAIGTDSGTSALVLALRIAAGPGGTVAMPGYACVDLVAAARYAGVNVMLYDVEPATLAPDLASIERVVRAGATTVVIVHLYGYPVDMLAINSLASAVGALVIEDAAQAAAGSLHGRRMGSFGDLAVLSFGRGKGVTGGGGGALLAHSAAAVERANPVLEHLPPGGLGSGDLGRATVQWALGRPAVYGIPASIPWLHLGETRYHPARAPRGISAAAAALALDAIRGADAARSARQRMVEILTHGATESANLAWVRPTEGSTPGYLRLPVRDLGSRQPRPVLGILRAYPRSLGEEPEMQPCLTGRREPLLGSMELVHTLFTVPVHHLVRAGDLELITAWLRASGQRSASAHRRPAAHAAASSSIDGR